MSLYDDIISKKDGDSDISSEWSTSKTSSIKLLQDHLQLKRTTQNLTKNNLNSTRKMMPIHVRPSKPAINEFAVASPLLGSNFTNSKSSSPLGGDWDVNDEYDPRWPNDYEKIIKERSESREKEFDAKKLKKETPNNFQITAIRSLGLDDYDDDDEDERSDEKAKSRANASFAPPPSLLENVEKVSSPASFGGGSSVAEKIMAKMGYRQGQGLGKEEQGISKALQVEKTGKTQGKIVLESEIPKNEEPTITDILKSPSTVVLLRNMVGPGEVDGELEPETKEECSKYGEVNRCVIFERQDYESDEDAVLIFIEFFRVESAVKAIIDLNGRYFGGRVVKASFYDQDRFNKRDFQT